MKKLYAAVLLLTSLISFAQLQIGPIPNFTQCDDNADGFATFDLSMASQMIYTSYPPNTYTVAYYVNMAAAQADTRLPLQYTNSTAHTQTLVVKVWETANATNAGFTTFDLIVNPAPVVTNTTLYACDDNNDGIGLFNLPGAETTITGGQPGYTITYFATTSDLQNNIAIATPSAYQSTQNTIVYAQVQNMDGCISIATITLNVVPRPNVSASLPVINTCGIIDLTANSELYSAYIATYHISPVDAVNGTNAIAAPAQYTSATASGMVWIRLTTQGTDCFTIIQQNYNTAVTDPTIIITQNGNTAIITTGSGLPTTYTIISAPDSYSNGVPFEQDTHILTNLSPGSYTLSVQDMCGNTSIITFIVVDAPTGATEQYFAQGDTLAVVEVEGENIEWYADEALTQRLTTDVMLIDGTTYYAVKSINGNKSIALAVTVHLLAGNNAIAKTTISLYPNPVTEVLTITANNEINTVQVYSITGQKVLTAKPKTSQVTLNLANLQAGLYFVRVNAASGSETLRIVKQ